MPNIFQPTILVKRADGTTVRMTLDELKSLKSKVKSQKFEPPVETSSSIKEPDFKVRIGVVGPRKKMDLKKLLSQKGMLNGENKPKQSIVDGLKNWKDGDHKSLLDESFHKDDLPVLLKNENRALSNASPVKGIFVDEAAARMAKPAVNRPFGAAPKSFGPKPIIHDVMPPRMKKISMGPIDELKNFSLIDWRRLGVNSKACGEKLMEKFKVLEQESWLTFMDGVEAWYNSPIYWQYKDIISQSLKQNRTISEVLSGLDHAQQLKLEEFMAIAELNKTINQ